MKYLALVYLVLYIVDCFYKPTQFGKQRQPKTYLEWIIETIIIFPLVCLLFWVFINK
jgi:hypothetical protein